MKEEERPESDYSVEPTNEFSKFTEKEQLEYWDKTYWRYRGQIEHEDMLYSQRIHWLIYIQALLFASLGLLMRVRFGESAGGAVEVVYLIIATICALGILIGGIANRVLNNSGEALDEIRDMWTALIKKGLPANIGFFFPHVAGGLGTMRTRAILSNKGEESFSKKNGRNPLKVLFRSRHIPKVFIGVWFAVLCVLIFDAVYYLDIV